MPPVVAQKFVGKWKEDGSQNFEEFMKLMDANWVKRKAEEKTDHKEEWMVHGDEITLKVSNGLSSETHKFIIGQQYDEKTLDGRKVKSTAMESGDRLIITSHGEPYVTEYSRELQGSLLVLTMTAQGAPHPVTAVRRYKRDD